MGRRHAENLRHLVPGAELVAIADADAGRAKRVAEELEVSRSYSTIDAMLACREVRCIVIVTPDRFHAEAVCAAAAAGKDILCEKLLALSVEEAQRALRKVADAGVRLQVGFMRRYDPAYKAAKLQIDAGEIGEPVIFKSVGRDKDAPPAGYYKSRLNGMLFFASSIHDFDLARWLMNDEVTDVHAYKTVAIRPELETYGDIVAGVVNLKYARGAIGNIESYAQGIYGYDVRTEVVGSKGSILIGTLRQNPAVFLKTSGGQYDLADHFLTRFADAYLAEMRDFVRSIAGNQDVQVTGTDGLRAVEIAVAAQKSCSNGIACPVSKTA